MVEKFNERRSSQRYDTKVEVYFNINFDLKTKVEYQVIDKKSLKPSEKYSAISKNVSSAGLAISSNKKLNIGDDLSLEVYLPDSKEPIKMNGIVKWSKKTVKNSLYDTGIKIITVENDLVKNTIFFDEVYQLEWSILLEKILGNFKNIANNWKKD